ncbi:MAG: hypothetical protein NZ891_08595 [bacterium]|nr:hypothetical protein [bacterium]MDW8164780.1 hypothetical protein [Candidatus Omnitrophota bacterium]
MQIKYLMVTSWDKHWDRIEKKTYYKASMLKGGLNKDDIKEDIQTIFIKINKANKKPEKG